MAEFIARGIMYILFVLLDGLLAWWIVGDLVPSLGYWDWTGIMLIASFPVTTALAVREFDSRS